MRKKKKVFIREYYPLLIIAVGFIVILLLGFFVFKFSVEKEKGKIIESLCRDFQNMKNEISCKEAIKLVLEKYPGEVKYINKTKASLPVGILPNTEMTEKEVWLIGVNLKPPMIMDERELKGMEIFVTRDSGELEINKVTSGEL